MNKSERGTTAAVLADHERRLLALEAGDDGIDPPGALPPELINRPVFEWVWNGRLDDFDVLMLEPQDGATGTVEQRQGFVRATCFRKATNETPKACGEKKFAFQPRAGQVVVIDLDVELHDCRSGAEIFLGDIEDLSTSSGTRVKLNETFHWRLDGGKLGFESCNDDLDRDGPEYALPRGRRVVASIEILLDEHDGGWVRILHDGLEVFLVECVPTMRGPPSKFQCLLTAYGASENAEVVLDTYGVRYRVFNRG